MQENQRVRLSKRMSKVLRHAPGSVGLTLDAHGWVAVDDLLAALRAHPLGAAAACIGEVVADEHGFVEMETRFGGRRVVDWLSGEQLPRLC